MATVAPQTREEALAPLAFFEQTFGYDAGYIREMYDEDPMAYAAFGKLNELAEYTVDIPKEALFTAKIVATMGEDCGPCVQLGVKLAEHAGIAPEVVRAVLAGDIDAMSEDVKLVYRYTETTLAHDPASDEYREAIITKWGNRALYSLAFGIIACRSYPTLRYALGHGQSCSRVLVDGQPAKLKNR